MSPDPLGGYATRRVASDCGATANPSLDGIALAATSDGTLWLASQYDGYDYDDQAKVYSFWTDLVLTRIPADPAGSPREVWRRRVANHAGHQLALERHGTRLTLATYLLRLRNGTSRGARDRLRHDRLLAKGCDGIEVGIGFDGLAAQLRAQLADEEDRAADDDQAAGPARRRASASAASARRPSRPRCNERRGERRQRLGGAARAGSPNASRRRCGDRRQRGEHRLGILVVDDRGHQHDPPAGGQLPEQRRASASAPSGLWAQSSSKPSSIRSSRPGQLHAGQPRRDRRVVERPPELRPRVARQRDRERGVVALVRAGERDRRGGDGSKSLPAAAAARRPRAARAADLRLGLGRQRAPASTGTPGFRMPAFSRAIAASVSPR